MAGFLSRLFGSPGQGEGAPQSEEARFWAWFAKSRAFLERRLVTQSFKADHFEEGAALLPKGMEWEIGRASDDLFELTISGGGPLQDRRVAERVIAAAPKFERWRFFPARIASPSGFVLRREGVECDPDEARFSLEVDELRRLVHVAVRHPGFAKAPSDGVLARAICYQLLDMLLGEDAVETWIGVVEVAKAESAAEVDGRGLKAALAELRETELQWALLRPERDDGKAALIRVCPGIKPRHWLAFDQHLSVTESYRPSDDDGLPSSEKLDKLNQAEDQLLATLGERAVFHGREVAAGRCVWHFHCDAEAEAVFRDWIGKSLPKAALERSADPAWANPEWRAG